MMSKTHLAIGIATSFWLLQPSTVSEIAMATIGGSIGGIIADIDVDIDIHNKSVDALYGQVIAIGISAFAVLVDYFRGGDIASSFIENRHMSIAATLIFLLLLMVGKKSNHRDKTHSILASVISSVVICTVNCYIGAAYFVAYMSHLIIDLLNKKPIQLFYPIKKGLCFKFCRADKMGNKLLLVLGVLGIILYFVY